MSAKIDHSITNKQIKNAIKNISNRITNNIDEYKKQEILNNLEKLENKQIYDKNIIERKQMEQELKERNGSAYSNLIKANTDLIDKLKWLEEDIQREISKINDSEITKEEIIVDLINILEKNKTNKFKKD